MIRLCFGTSSAAYYDKKKSAKDSTNVPTYTAAVGQRGAPGYLIVATSC